jgi:hypothetical protein
MSRVVFVLPALMMSFCAAMVSAKLPPPSDEAKAKAAEAAAKTAYADKVAAYKLCKSMDKVAADYHAAGKKAGKPTPPPVTTPPCTDPGPFVAAAPAAPTAPAKPPLEAAGAHSPPKTATAPPSSNTLRTEPAPNKK